MTTTGEGGTTKLKSPCFSDCSRSDGAGQGAGGARALAVSYRERAALALVRRRITGGRTADLNCRLRSCKSGGTHRLCPVGADAPSTVMRSAARCGCSSMVEQQPSKLMTRVRFPSPAPISNHLLHAVVLILTSGLLLTLTKRHLPLSAPPCCRHGGAALPKPRRWRHYHINEGFIRVDVGFQ